jgi:hypothetical protein
MKLVYGFVIQELVYVPLDLVFIVRYRNLLYEYIVLDEARDITLP